ncbi:MAG: hypothetical protein QHJ73_15015, partial [Armatimonadota bacterium]|nr:hypothetical protein [Armatimonadota bacterium]
MRRWRLAAPAFCRWRAARGLCWWVAAAVVLAVAPGAAQPNGEGTPPPPPERRLVRQVAPGVQHLQVLRESLEAPLVVHVLRLDPSQAGWRLQVWPASDVLLSSDASKGREAVGKLAARRGALAALNGDFFPFTGDPLGLQVTDGELYSDPYPGRSAFGITRDGRTLWGPVRLQGTFTAGARSLPIQGVNRARKADELVVYTSRWGARTGTNGAGTEVVVEWLEGALTPGR